MMRNIAIFLLCFAVGAIAAVVLRTALHRPYALTAAEAPAPAPAPAATVPALAPAATPAATATAALVPINTICPICGMKVDPKIPPAIWQGKAIGFGCKACPPRFPANADKYGRAALENKVVEE